MNVLIAFLITVAVIAVIARLYVVNDKMIQFFSKGLDSNFRLSEIGALWSLAKRTKLEDPVSLFVSVNILNSCIKQFIEDSKSENTQNSFKTQQLLTKLYDYRTRIALDSVGKCGIETSRQLDIGQRLRIILSGKGVFAAKLLSNGQNLIITLPRQEDKKNHRFIVLEKELWEEHLVSIYFWRKGDAGYAFDSKVIGSGVFQGQDCLFLEHSMKLDRTQKRHSVRVLCNIYAQMYFIKDEVVDYNSVNADDGFRCLLEDISEDGALIRVGGAGKSNIRIKLQFELNGTFIMMYGVVRAVEYNKEIEQSRLHFECTHIDPAMKNAILAFVYNVLPNEEKEINEAITESENDEKEEEMERMVSGRVEEKTGIIVEEGKPESPLNGAASIEGSGSADSGTEDKYFGMGGVDSLSMSSGSASSGLQNLTSGPSSGMTTDEKKDSGNQ